MSLIQTALSKIRKVYDDVQQSSYGRVATQAQQTIQLQTFRQPAQRLIQQAPATPVVGLGRLMQKTPQFNLPDTQFTRAAQIAVPALQLPSFVKSYGRDVEALGQTFQQPGSYLKRPNISLSKPSKASIALDLLPFMGGLKVKGGSKAILNAEKLKLPLKKTTPLSIKTAVGETLQPSQTVSAIKKLSPLATEAQEAKLLPEKLYDPKRLEIKVREPYTSANPGKKWELQVRYKGFAADKLQFDTKLQAESAMKNYKFKGMTTNVGDVYSGSHFEETYRSGLRPRPKKQEPTLEPLAIEATKYKSAEELARNSTRPTDMMHKLSQIKDNALKNKLAFELGSKPGGYFDNLYTQAKGGVGVNPLAQLKTKLDTTGTAEVVSGKNWGVAIKDEGDFFSVRYGSKGLTEIGTFPSGERNFRTKNEAVSFAKQIQESVLNKGKTIGEQLQPKLTSVSMEGGKVRLRTKGIEAAPKNRILTQQAVKAKNIVGQTTPKVEQPITGGGGQQGNLGGTSSDGIIPPTDPIQKIITALKQSKPLERQQSQIYAKIRSQQAGAIAGVGQNVPGEAGFHAQLSKLKGGMPKVEFESIRKQIKQPDIDSLFNKVEQSNILTPFEKISAKSGLAKLLGAEGGSVPVKSELSLLNEVFPPDFIQAVLNKRPLMSKLF